MLATFTAGIQVCVWNTRFFWRDRDLLYMGSMKTTFYNQHSISIGVCMPFSSWQLTKSRWLKSIQFNMYLYTHMLYSMLKNGLMKPVVLRKENSSATSFIFFCTNNSFKLLLNSLSWPIAAQVVMISSFIHTRKSKKSHYFN